MSKWRTVFRHIQNIINLFVYIFYIFLVKIKNNIKCYFGIWNFYEYLLNFLMHILQFLAHIYLHIFPFLAPTTSEPQ